MQATVLTTLLVGAVAACHTSAQGTHDGRGDDDTDAPTDGAGLSVHWATRAPIPGDVTSEITVGSMVYRIANLRVIGDAGPGDNRTSQDTFSASWDTGVVPATITFTDAPSGLYSKIVLLADANFIDYAYEIHGTVKISGTPTPYKIHDRTPIGVSLDTSAMLEPGRGTSVTIRADMAKAFEGLDFSKLTNDNGTLELDTFDNQMSDFRNRMMSSVFDSPHEGTN